MVEVEIASYEGWLVGEGIMGVSESVENTKFSSWGVVVNVDDGSGGVVCLGDFENLNVSVFYQVRPEGDGEVLSGPEVG